MWRLCGPKDRWTVLLVHFIYVIPSLGLVKFKGLSASIWEILNKTGNPRISFLFWLVEFHLLLEWKIENADWLHLQSISCYVIKIDVKCRVVYRARLLVFVDEEVSKVWYVMFCAWQLRMLSNFYPLSCLLYSKSFFVVIWSVLSRCRALKRRSTFWSHGRGETIGVRSLRGCQVWDFSKVSSFEYEPNMDNYLRNFTGN